MGYQGKGRDMPLLRIEMPAPSTFPAVPVYSSSIPAARFSARFQAKFLHMPVPVPGSFPGS